MNNNNQMKSTVRLLVGEEVEVENKRYKEALEIKKKAKRELVAYLERQRALEISAWGPDPLKYPQ